MSDNLLKAMGWSISASPINGEIYAYRVGTPGMIILRATESHYQFEAYSDDGDIMVASASAAFTSLQRPE